MSPLRMEFAEFLLQPVLHSSFRYRAPGAVNEEVRVGRHGASREIIGGHGLRQTLAPTTVSTASSLRSTGRRNTCLR
jgi:hypothetical protein